MYCGNAVEGNVWIIITKRPVRSAYKQISRSSSCGLKRPEQCLRACHQVPNSSNQANRVITVSMTAMLLKVLSFNTKRSKPIHGCQPERSGNLIRLCECDTGRDGNFRHSNYRPRCMHEHTIQIRSLLLSGSNNSTFTET